MEPQAMSQTKARILHVDDHQDTRLMIAALLHDRGYGVLTAGSVSEALELANAAASVVIHQLGTTGTATVAQIREVLLPGD